jgi:hypothetical protein
MVTFFAERNVRKGGTMKHPMWALILLLLSTAMVFGQVAEEKLPGIYTEYQIDSDGTLASYTTIYTGAEYIPAKAINRTGAFSPLYSDTAVLWVDRIHQNAVAENVSITGDGMSIFAGWWLNNERVSLYRSLGDGLPLWAFGTPLANWQIDVASSEDGHLLAATSSGTPFRLWDKVIPIPLMEYRYPSGFISGDCAVSKDGSTAAAAADNGMTGRLFVFDANGDSLYAVDFDRGRGVYGVDLSSDGSIALVSTYDVHSIFENGSLRQTISNYGQTPAKISADGSRLVKGDFSANVTLYEWNGSSYIQQWQSNIGGPWVVSVAISDDGSTVAAGTGYSNGKTVLFDASSSTPLWTYQYYGSYGAYVRAVSLSDDGSMCAAASWGDTAQTGDFYVLTVHARNDSSPIIGVTRNDEPGSLFDCDISSDGENITAGGKAVHAYQWGNGGEVYSVLVGSTPSINAATEQILNPTRFVQVGNSISPRAIFRNYGDNTASFDVYVLIEDSSGATVYSSSNSVASLAPGDTAHVIFSPYWSPSAYNYFNAQVWCELTGDQYPGDDTISLDIKCFHDAEARAIQIPYDETTVSMQITPRALVYNNGSYTESIQSILSLRDSVGTLIYCDTTLSSVLSPEQEATVTFAPLSPSPVGDYNAELIVSVTDDIYPGNNVRSKDFYVSYEIIYDDGGAEAYYVVSSTYDNNKFATRFTPTLTPPFDLVGGRIFVNATDPFDYVQLCDDAGGLPDTVAPLREIYNVSSSSSPDWAYFTFDTLEVTSVRDFWLVFHWPPASPGSPGVGADDFMPTLRSWWYNITSGWNNWTNHNWMIRLKQSPELTAVKEETSSYPSCYYLYKNYPNPFRTRTAISFDLPEETFCELLVFDAAGRCIRTLRDAAMKPGHHTVMWDGRNQQGNTVSNGIYFYRLQTARFSKAQKLVVIK